MPAASHQTLLHAAFIVSTDSGPRAQEDEEDNSLVYAYPSNASAGSTGSYIKTFSSLIVTVRGALDSICGEKTRLVCLEHGGSRLLLASAHLESVMLVLALRSVVPPSAATSLAVHLAETLVLLMGPFACWGLGRGASLEPSSQQGEAWATLDRIFDGVLSQINSPAWGARMAPWNSFEHSCLHLALPPPLHQRLTTLVAEHSAQRHNAPFSFFRKHSCLMYRGLLLASDMHPLHAKQLWQLLWTLGVQQHSGGLPCQILTRAVHLTQPEPGSGGRSQAAGSAAAAAVALQAESGVTVSEQQMGRSLLVVVSALKLVLAVVLTAYDEEIEEELAGRLEGHFAAELLQRIHMCMGADLERLVDASVVYGAAAHSLEAPPPPPPGAASVRSPPAGPSKHHSGASVSGGSLLFKVMTRNRTTPPRPPAPRGPPGAGEGPSMVHSSPSSPNGKTLPRSAPPSSLPPGHPVSLAARPAPPGGSNLAAGPSLSAGQPHDRPVREPAPASSAAPGGVGLTSPFTAAAAGAAIGCGATGGGSVLRPVAAPEGALFLIAHDVPQGCVRFMGDLPSGDAMAAVWRAVAACRGRFGLHNVAVAAPPKHARLTMTLDQILQLSAARSQKLGGQRLGTADSSPWQYHPELASLAAVNTITLRLPGLLANGTMAGAEGEAGPAAGVGAGGGEGVAAAGGSPPQKQQQQPQDQQGPATPGKSWLARMSGSRPGSRPGSPDGGGASGDALLHGSGGAAAAAPPHVAAAASLYLTAVLFPDTREVYMCHTADVDETKMAEAMWEGTMGQELWLKESVGVAS